MWRVKWFLTNFVTQFACILLRWEKQDRGGKMLSLIVMFVFQQTFADGTWPMYGGTLENTHIQIMSGAMTDTPVVKWSYVARSMIETAGEVVDLDNDSTMEVVVEAWDSTVYCLNGTTGAVEWSFNMGMFNYTSHCAAVGDVDNDGFKEVVVGVNKVYCLNGANGNVKWSYNNGIANFMGWCIPKLADVDNNGAVEVIMGYAGMSDNKTFCFNGTTGAIKWSSPIGIVAPAISDINGDGNKEIFTGGACLNGATGATVWGSSSISCPSVADIDKDGIVEVLVGDMSQNIRCYNANSGASKWVRNVGNDNYWSAPSLMDVDGDNIIEVITGGDKVYCLDGVSGAIEWSYNVGAWVHCGTAIADVDGDKKPEVISSVFGGKLYCINAENGSQQWVKNEIYNDIHDPTIADVDNDKCLEVLLGTCSDSKLWVLDDVTNRNNCGSMGIEEGGKKQEVRDGIEFKAIGDRIHLFTPNGTKASIKIYDLCGREKGVIYSGTLSEGNYTFSPNITGKGLYFIVLNTKNISKSLKFIKL